MIISYKSIINKINLEALRLAPDGNLYTGYHVLNGRKMQLSFGKEVEVYITPWLTEDLKIDVEVVVERTKQTFQNVKGDLELG